MSDGDRPAQMRPWLRGVLFGSLALNLAVAGLVAGMLLKGPPEGHTRDRDPVAPYTRAFEEGQRKALYRDLRARFEAERRTERAEGRSDLVDDYRTALALLRADPFDPGAFRARLTEQGNRSEERRARGNAVLTDYLAGLSATERAAYADRLEAEVQEIEARRARWKKDRD